MRGDWILKRLVGLAALCALLFCLWPVEAAAWPQLPADTGAVVIDAQTGRVIFGHQEHEVKPMASLTKMMTAYLTLQQPDLEAYFEVPAAAVGVEGSSMGLQLGDQVSLEALAVGQLLPSGNDAAAAAAIHIAGSEAAFAEQMNAQALAWGLGNTHFTNPHGLDATGHQSTAYDLAQIARHAIQDENFLKICSSARMACRFGNPPEEHTFTNHNRLLEEYEGCIGVKTGYTSLAGRCLASAARREGVTLICVTLHYRDDWNLHKQLLDEAFAQVQAVPLNTLGLPENLPLAGAQSPLLAVAPAQAAVTLSREEIPQARVEVIAEPFLSAPVEKGQVVGRALCRVGEQTVYQTPLLAEETVPALPEPKKGFWQRLFG